MRKFFLLSIFLFTTPFLSAVHFCRQYQYDDDFMYDVSLDIEADKNGNMEAIVPDHRKHKHR